MSRLAWCLALCLGAVACSGGAAGEQPADETAPGDSGTDDAARPASGHATPGDAGGAKGSDAVSPTRGDAGSVRTGAEDDAGPVGAGTSRGTIQFHLLLGVSGSSTAGDSLDLGGDRYADLIASNFVAGVMLGHLIGRFTPGMQLDKDYLYGTMFGQLLQENLATELYSPASGLIDSSPDQQAVMGAGQGGPYQINNYAADMVYGTYSPKGYSLINYVALQKNIGYSFVDAPTQYSKATPASFNDKYYGPMLTAYFHFNDYLALQKIGPLGGYTPQWEPYYDEALATFQKLPGNFLEVLLNVAYNQGYYGTLVTSYSKEGATATASTVASVDAYSSIWGVDDTYQQYPYQVRDYLDQLYDNPAPQTGTVPDNHVVFRVEGLGGVFADVFATLAYQDPSTGYSFIPANQATQAFASAAVKAGVEMTGTLDLSVASDRARIFAVLEDAVSTLESSLGTDFTATTRTAL